MTAHLPKPQTSPAAQVGALAVFPLSRAEPLAPTASSSLGNGACGSAVSAWAMARTEPLRWGVVREGPVPSLKDTSPDDPGTQGLRKGPKALVRGLSSTEMPHGCTALWVP